jgi:7,8-dihydroneopterin aldolase/epimerase/oxygenase
VSDRIVVAGMVFLARHGVNDWEKVEEQRFEVDVELVTDTRPAGTSDDLATTVDYRRVYAIVREVLEDTTSELIETLAEEIAGRILAANGAVDEVVVRVRKPDVDLGGPLEYAGVEIRRRRDGSARAG